MRTTLKYLLGTTGSVAIVVIVAMLGGALDQLRSAGRTLAGVAATASSPLDEAIGSVNEWASVSEWVDDSRATAVRPIVEPPRAPQLRSTTASMDVSRQPQSTRPTVDSARATDPVLAAALDDLVSDPDPAVREAVLAFFANDTEP
jgi:hypothetical protein